jgi:hypothetical protein
MAILRAYSDDVSNEQFERDEKPLYYYVNRALFLNSEDELAKWGSYARAVKASLWQECTHELPNAVFAGSPRGILEGPPRVVHRKMHLEKELLDEYTDDFVFLWPNFVSTSLRDNAYSSEDFGTLNVHFKIDLDSPRNEGVTYMYNLSSLSSFDENEVLFYPYSGFRVIKREELGEMTIITLCTVDTRAVDENPCGVWTGPVPLEEIEAYRQSRASKDSSVPCKNQSRPSKDSSVPCSPNQKCKSALMLLFSDSHSDALMHTMFDSWREISSKKAMPPIYWSPGQGGGKVQAFSSLQDEDMRLVLLGAKARMDAQPKLTEAQYGAYRECLESIGDGFSFEELDFKTCPRDGMIAFFAYLADDEKIVILESVPEITGKNVRRTAQRLGGS